MSKVANYLNNKGEKIFSLCLLCTSVILMLFCAIVRLCGGLWFTADLSKIPTPEMWLQEIIKGVLLVFEATFVFKILCRKKWLVCIGLAILYTLLGIAVGAIFNNVIVSNVYYALCYLFVPIIFVRKWYSLLDNVILYITALLYGLLFSVGRIGGITQEYAYNFVVQVLSGIDYKLFFVALYLYIKNFGGIKLWKKQKRPFFRTDLSTM